MPSSNKTIKNKSAEKLRKDIDNYLVKNPRNTKNLSDVLDKYPKLLNVECYDDMEKGLYLIQTALENSSLEILKVVLNKYKKEVLEEELNKNSLMYFIYCFEDESKSEDAITAEEKLKMLVSKGFKLDKQDENYAYRYLLFTNTINTKFLKYLLDSGVNVNLDLDEGYTTYFHDSFVLNKDHNILIESLKILLEGGLTIYNEESELDLLVFDAVEQLGGDSGSKVNKNEYLNTPYLGDDLCTDILRCIYQNSKDGLDLDRKLTGKDLSIVQYCNKAGYFKLAKLVMNINVENMNSKLDKLETKLEKFKN